jgi:hypoxanthine phosphoribosyltransferase
MSKPIDGVPSDIIAAREAAECLFDAAAVERAVDQLAVRLTIRLHDAHPIVMCVMTGGIILTSELLLRLHFPLEVSYVHATRYRDATQG